MESEAQQKQPNLFNSGVNNSKLFGNFNFQSEDGVRKIGSQSPNNSATPTTSSTPPLLLLPPTIICDQAKDKDSDAQKMQVDHKEQVGCDDSSRVRAMIETTDPNVMSKIVNTIKQLYPEINIHMFSSNNNSASTNETKLSVISKGSEKLKKEDEKNYLGTNEASRNSLSTNYFLDKKTCDRASSIDNSSLTSMERQESKDSGFWSMSKCSFESMKSLSISDSSHPNEAAAAAAAVAASYRPLVNTDPEKLHQASLSPSSSHKNELDVSRRFLTSPTNKSSMYNWKKWKKGQAWRYSSSNVSQLDSNSSATIENCLTTTNSSFNSNNSSFSNEKAEDDLNEACKMQLANTSGYFSNSFELATSRLSIQPSRSEQLWSSTSKLETLNDQNNNCVSFKAQKRRGKLVRDRTIDNADEQSSCSNSAFSNFNPASSTSCKENKSNHNSNSNLNTISNNNCVENLAPGGNGTVSPLNGSTLSLNKEKLCDNSNSANIKPKAPLLSSQQQTGRISPPEKRVSLSIKQYNKMNMYKNNSSSNNNESMSSFDLENEDKEKNSRFNDDGIKSQQQQASFSPASSTSSTSTSHLDHHNPPAIINPQNLNLLISHLFTNKLLAEQQQIKTSLGMSNEIKQSNTPQSASAASSPNSIASCISPGLTKCKQFPAKSDSPADLTHKQHFDAHSTTPSMFAHYDVYKDLQSKLNLRASEQEDQPGQLDYPKYPNYLTNNNTNIFSIKSGNEPESLPNVLNHPFSIDHMFKNRDVLNNDQASMHHHRLSPNGKHSFMLKNFNSSSFDSQNFLSTNINNNNAPNINDLNNGQQQQAKVIYRSNSSPSHPSSPVPPHFNQASSTSSNSLLTPVHLMQLNGESSSPSPPANKISPNNNSSPFQINLQSFSFNNHNNNKAQSESPPTGTNNAAASAQNCNKTSPQQQQQQQHHHHNLFNNLNYYQTMNPMRYEKLFPYDPNLLSKQQQQQIARQILAKPPEIVITESKSDNDQIDYDVDLNDTNNKKLEAFKINHETPKQMLDENKPLLSRFLLPELLQRPSQSDYSNQSKHMNDPHMFTFENILKKSHEGFYDELKTGVVNQANSSKNPSSSKVVKPHVCTSCQKRFARSDMLIRHSRLHSGVRPYKCNRCGQEFSRSDHLNTHLRTHTGEKPYSCPHPKCTYAACRKDMITRHLKVHAKNKLSLSFESDKLNEQNKLMFDSSTFNASFLNNNNTHKPIEIQKQLTHHNSLDISANFNDNNRQDLKNLDKS